MKKTSPSLKSKSIISILFLVLSSIPAFCQFDVALSKTTVTNSPVKYGTPIPFNLTIHNQGLDTITNVEIIEHYGNGYEFQAGLNPDWSFHPTLPNAVTTTYMQPVPPGESRIVTINLIAQQGTQVEDWINIAEVVDFTDRFGISQENADTDSTGDELPNNDAGGLLGSPADDAINGDGTGSPNDGVASTDEDDHDRDTIQVFDLAITTILDPTIGYNYGDTLTFTATVYNQGNVRARFIRIRDIVPEGYINPLDVNTAAGWSNDAANPIYQIDVLEPFSQVDVDLKLILAPNQVDGDSWINYVEIISARFDDLTPIGVNLDADSEMASNTEGERSVKQGDPDDNNIDMSSVNPGDQDDHDPAEPEVFDLALIKERATAVASFNYNTPISYSYTVINQGNMSATDIILVDSLPCGTSFDQLLNPDWSFNPSTRIATRTISGPLEPLSPGVDDHTITDTLILTVVSCFEDQETAWTNLMEIAQATNINGVQTQEIDGVFDSNFSNDPGGIPLSSSDNQLTGIGIFDEDNHDAELLEVYDLALKKELITEGPYTEGQDLDFRIRIYNQGNIVIEDLVVEDFVPEGLGYDPAVNAPLGWTNSYTTLVAGIPTVFDDTLNVMEDIFLATEDSIDVFIRLTLELDGKEESDWYNFAHIFVATDTIGNNRFDDADSNPMVVTPAENAVIPGGINDNNLISPGKVAIPAEEEDDHDVANISFFDLALSKTATSTPNAYGQDVTFDILVKNEGVQYAHDITVIDYLPCGLTFTSSPGWALNAITGNPEFFFTDTLFAGEEITIPITLSIEECNMIDADSYRNLAEIGSALDPNGNTGDDQDSTPNNQDPNEDDIDDALISVFDLSLSKSITTPPSNFMEGSSVVYEIIISNEGNVPASNIEITDYLPCGLEFSATGNTGWTQDIITGNISYVEATQIAPGSNIAVPLTLTIGSCENAPVDLDNLVEISNDDLGGPQDDFDSTPDNGDPDEDDLDTAPLDFFDLSLTKTLTTNATNLTYGQNLNYEITVTNEGTIPATSYTVTDYLPCGLIFDQANNPGWSQDPQNGDISYEVNTTLNSGMSNTLNLVLELAECAMPTLSSWNNTAEITDATDTDGPANDDDSTPNNGDPDEDDQDNAPLDIFDLSLTKIETSSQEFYLLGDEVVYNIEVTNEGNIPASNFQITDYIPCGMSLAPSNMIGWVNSIDGYAEYTYPSTLQPGSSQAFEIRLIVDICPMVTDQRINIAEITDNGSGDPDDVDSTPGNENPDEDDQDDVSVDVNLFSTIGDFVWNDTNGDGIQDSNESGIPSVTVILYDTNDEIVAVVVTDSDGAYSFDEVEAGDYYIVFENIDDELIVSPTGSGNDANDSNVTEDNGPNSTSTFTVNPGVDDETIDGGFFACSLIKGVSYYDINEDDIRQPTENGINGLDVNLYRNVNGTWVLWDSETTHHDFDTPSDDGIWDFCVAPGQYYIEVVLPPIGLVRVRPFIGGSNYDSDINGANGVNTTPSFTIPPGGSKTDLGAGYYPMATVGNRVWFDENANGIQEEDEQKAEGVTVQVFNMANELIEETVTDADGVYTVEYLKKEDYYLRFQAPEGYTFTFANATGDDNDSDVNHAMGLNTTSPRSFNPGEEVVNIDAGLLSGVLPLTWGDLYAKKENKFNLVHWSTKTEINVKSFEIERQLEGEEQFIPIGSISAIGNSNTERRYSFSDADINQAGYYFYRIKQIDFDGKSSYSDIFSAWRGIEGTYTAYPNPTSGKVTINGDFTDLEILSIKIVDSNGETVSKIDNLNPSNLELNLDHLAAGLYQIEVSSKGRLFFSERIIKI